MKLLFVVLLIASLAEARHLNSGVVMCKSEEGVLKVLEATKGNNFWDTWSYLVQARICTESAARMYDGDTNRFIDLGNGVTKVHNLYFATQDIRNP